MPDTTGPADHAARLSKAARTLAHATEDLDDPAESSAVIAGLQDTLASVRQSLHHLADAHTRAQDDAITPDGSRLGGRECSRVTAAILRTVADDLDRATDLTEAAIRATGRLIWQTTPPASAATELAERATHLAPDEHPTTTRPPAPPAPEH